MARFAEPKGTTLVRFLLCIVAVVVCSPTIAQRYPDRPIKIVIAYPPGGGLDIVVRAMAPLLTERLGQPIIVENRAGASGAICTEYVARSAPDGYTPVMGTNSTHAIMPNMRTDLPYDALKDFSPITPVVLITNLVVVNPSVPVSSIEELVKFARSNPDGLNYGSAGAGSTTHVAMELLKIDGGHSCDARPV